MLWPGVTVEKKEGYLKGNKEIKIVDLPGIYSLSPYTPEEIITRDFLINEQPDVILNIIDASNIERNLYLTTQLMETTIHCTKHDGYRYKEWNKDSSCQTIQTIRMSYH